MNGEGRMKNAKWKSRMIRLAASGACLMALNSPALIVTNEVDGTFDSTSYDTQPYKLWGDYFACYFYCMYPQFTNHIYSVSRSGASWENQFESQQQKWCLPLWASFPVDANDWMLATENGGYNTTNQLLQWGTNLFNAPPLFWDGASITNEGNIVPHAITHIALGAIPDQTSDGNPGNLQLDTGCQMLNQMYGLTPVPLYTNIYVPYWSNDFAGAQLTGFYSGGHPYPAGHLDMAFETLLLLGAETNIGSVTFNWAAATASTNHCTANSTSLSGGTLTSTIHFDRMPPAWDVPGDPTPGGSVTNDARGGFTVMPQLAIAFQWTLQVTNLPTGNYNVLIDGSNVVALSSSQLAAGWNMFTNYNGPLWAQRVAVLMWKRYQGGVDPVTLVEHSAGVQGAISGVGDLVNFQSNGAQQYETLGKRGSDYVSAMSTWISQLHQYDVAIWQAAQQTNHTFQITLQQPRFAPYHR